ncbi:MAG: hypothetical protein COB02_08430 [Candidatus Cloacimonadota bacterium]|nr:MAG: hypothetical protein COB02_08430 [Candidatus Cloacimonadota bacterium]
MLYLKFLFVLTILLTLVGCGGSGGGGDFSVPTQIVPVLSNSSVEGKDYDLISVQYSPARSAILDLFDHFSIHFNTNEVRNNPSIFEQDQNIKLKGYNLNSLKNGLGTITLSTSNSANQLTDLAVTPDGAVGVFSLDNLKNTSPVLGVFIESTKKSVLSTSLFVGDWGFISLSSAGKGVVAQLSLSYDVVKEFGEVSEGYGFSTTISGNVAASAIKVQTSNITLNSDRDRLLFLNSSWHVGVNESIAISPSGTGALNDRLSILMKTSEKSTFNATYNVSQWTAFSPTSNRSTVNRTGLVLSEIIQQGSLTFTGSRVTLKNIIDLADRETNFTRVEGGLAGVGGHMLRFDPNFEGNNIDFKFRFFVSKDEEFLVGLDYDNDGDSPLAKASRATFIIGIKQH